jgi:hypothetical protein
VSDWGTLESIGDSKRRGDGVFTVSIGDDESGEDPRALGLGTAKMTDFAGTVDTGFLALVSSGEAVDSNRREG